MKQNNILNKMVVVKVFDRKACSNKPVAVLTGIGCILIHQKKKITVQTFEAFHVWWLSH